MTRSASAVARSLNKCRMFGMFAMAASARWPLDIQTRAEKAQKQSLPSRRHTDIDRRLSG